MASIPYVATATGDAVDAPDGSIPIDLYGAGGDGAGIVVARFADEVIGTIESAAINGDTSYLRIFVNAVPQEISSGMYGWVLSVPSDYPEISQVNRVVPVYYSEASTPNTRAAGVAIISVTYLSDGTPLGATGPIVGIVLQQVYNADGSEAIISSDISYVGFVC